MIRSPVARAPVRGQCATRRIGQPAHAPLRQVASSPWQSFSKRLIAPAHAAHWRYDGSSTRLDAIRAGTPGSCHASDHGSIRETLRTAPVPTDARGRRAARANVLVMSAGWQTRLHRVMIPRCRGKSIAAGRNAVGTGIGRLRVRRRAEDVVCSYSHSCPRRFGVPPVSPVSLCRASCAGDGGPLTGSGTDRMHLDRHVWGIRKQCPAGTKGAD